MVNIIMKELSLEESLKKKIEFICDFTNYKPTIINWYKKKIDRNDLTFCRNLMPFTISSFAVKISFYSLYKKQWYYLYHYLIFKLIILFYKILSLYNYNKLNYFFYQ